MWHEARKQERKIRGMLVDYRRRAERRRDFYEKIKADPTQFLQVHGRQCKIHLDPTIAAAAEGPATMMPWQGHSENLIDRFDVRAHLDVIPVINKLDVDEITYEERQYNYERYRIIAQNSFLVINEEKFLKQLHLEEQFGYTDKEEPKKKKTGGAAIGFNYEDGTGTSQSPVAPIPEESSDEGSDSDLDVDLLINVAKIDQTQAHEMNRQGRNFGMSSNDFYSFLTNDLEEAESYRVAKEEEHEKALFSGRKSRRERRAHREKRLANRKISPPSYAAKESPTLVTHEKSESRSPSPENTGKITFITSFGDEEEPQMPIKPTYADKVKFGNKFKKLRAGSEERTVYRDSGFLNTNSNNERVIFRKRNRSRSKSNDRKRIRSRRSSTSSQSRSRSRSRNRRSRSSSRTRRRFQTNSKRKSISKSRSSSRSKSAKSSSRSKSVSRSRSKSLSRSPSSSSSSSSSSDDTHKGDSPPKTVPRYYGRKKDDHSSSEIGDSSEDNEHTNEQSVPSPILQNTTNSKIGNNSGTSTKIIAPIITSSSSANLQERLKRKRQALLNKQFKADKIAEQIKTEREKQEQQAREDELREMALKLRRKQREKRHAYDSDSSDSSTNSESKTAVVSSCEPPKTSRSNSPKPVRESKKRDERDDDYKGRNKTRENSRERSYSRRSPKSSRYDDKRSDESRSVENDKRNDDGVFNRYNRDERRGRDDGRRDNYRRDYNRNRGGKSLVDY